jgi:hypothetical protein
VRVRGSALFTEKGQGGLSVTQQGHPVLKRCPRHTLERNRMNRGKGVKPFGIQIRCLALAQKEIEFFTVSNVTSLVGTRNKKRGNTSAGCQNRYLTWPGLLPFPAKQRGVFVLRFVFASHIECPLSRYSRLTCN